MWREIRPKSVRRKLTSARQPQWRQTSLSPFALKQPGPNLRLWFISGGIKATPVDLEILLPFCLSGRTARQTTSAAIHNNCSQMQTEEVFTILFYSALWGRGKGLEIYKQLQAFRTRFRITQESRHYERDHKRTFLHRLRIVWVQ